jgi:hypothetical protein
MRMSHPTKAQKLLRAAREGQPVQRVEIPRVTCEQCGQEGLLATPDGATPRPHLRPAVQGDPGWSEIVPVRVECEERAATSLEELAARLPEELRVKPELMPAEVAAAIDAFEAERARG